MNLEIKLLDDSDDRDDLSELVTDVTPVEAPRKQPGSLDVNQTLAEMSYLEALDRLSSGDRFGAMERLKEACNYAPENQDYRAKLNQLLKEEANAKKQELAKKQPSAKKAEEAHPPAEVLEMKPAVRSLRQPNAQTPRFITYEEAGLVSKPKVSVVDKIVLAGIAMVLIVVGVYLAKKKDVIINVKLTSPVNEVRVEQDDIEFFWEANASYFLLTIDSSSDRVMEIYTEETHYKLTPSELAKLQPNTSYKWKVTPVDIKRDPLPSKTDEFWFEVVK